MIAIRRHPRGPRLYLVGRRIHHGPACFAMAAAALAIGKRRIAVGLLVYAATDWKDFPFRDTDNH